MSQGGESRVAFRLKSAEVAVAALFFLAGAILVYDSARVGFGWQEVHGPQAGYFPFYIGVFICISVLINVVRALLLRPEQNKPFVHVGQLKMVLAVLVPSAIYVTGVTWIGIYVSSILFIGFFMRWLGRYPWWKVVTVSVAAVAVFYLIFEVWFLVPLPKGPAESWLGLN